MTLRSPITTHVLNTSLGRPAVGVATTLYRLRAPGHWDKLAEGTTDADGRVSSLLSPGTLTAGQYRLNFATQEYFQAQGVATLFPAVSIEFSVTSAESHYHVPLLLSPFGYSTYRGS